jgi:hypothetical protein
MGIQFPNTDPGIPICPVLERRQQAIQLPQEGFHTASQHVESLQGGAHNHMGAASGDPLPGHAERAQQQKKRHNHVQPVCESKRHNHCKKKKTQAFSVTTEDVCTDNCFLYC